MSMFLNRRAMLHAMTALAGAAALSPPLLGSRPARAAELPPKPDLPKDFGKGKSVAILGAGVAGLTAAYTLAGFGFKVQVFEADSRYGGRSLTARPSNEDYKAWWFSKYDPDKLFPAMYVDRYQERPDSPAPDLQVCEFMDDAWDPKISDHGPVELFLNAGPGRIPSNHVNLINLCKEIGVALEPYIFQSMSNLLQSAEYNQGKPVSFAQITYSLYGEMAADMYAKVAHEARKLKGEPAHATGMVKVAHETHKAKARAFGVNDTRLQNLYRQFGDLNEHGKFQDTTRIGFSDVPGGWRDKGKVRDVVAMDKILDSRFIGNADENPELSPGSFLFNSFNIDWQPTLMQPIGGMDRVWQRLLVQDVPASALWSTEAPPKAPKVGDLVRLKAEAAKVVPSADKVEVSWKADGNKMESATFDFCISTMAPSLLKAILPKENSLPKAFNAGLEAFSKTGKWHGDPTPDLWTPAIKVGWQGKTRFWETDDQIYGGISWTTDIIGQIWYPSEDFNAHTGILTGAYNRGTDAATYAKQNNAARLETARKGLGLLHPGKQDAVEYGMSIAWQYMPHQVGGWASDTASTNEKIYEQITTFEKDSRFFCAGDTWSYWPGWQEGSITSAYCAIYGIARTMQPAKYSDCSCFG
ncbi:FAD-dependent oxidoreductase [Jiella sp. MQZ9-1]|uniref:FAD-dependent oxidoreductase n=1 Tax=Jiella flava TaxID=2816857 RepID=A0A939FX38_9HYPH|nr:FAD-dependent oxidoreductase [Jiella flava]MBO0661765.1 FAD-dependent oxidoreductase [Jiella flava]MCD2470406.1 FAD-dependent oxidoreductase [Jiella flava]